MPADALAPLIAAIMLLVALTGIIASILLVDWIDRQKHARLKRSHLIVTGQAVQNE